MAYIHPQRHISIPFCNGMQGWKNEVIANKDALINRQTITEGWNADRSKYLGDTINGFQGMQTFNKNHFEVSMT